MVEELRFGEISNAAGPLRFTKKKWVLFGFADLLGL
jgi:hypothetical protein